MVYYKLVLLWFFLPGLLLSQDRQPFSPALDVVTGMNYQQKNAVESDHSAKASTSQVKANGVHQDTLRSSKIISFDLSTVDTLQFENRFNEIGEVPIYGLGSELLLFDSNKNGLDEIIGIFWDSDAPLTGVTQYYELNIHTNTFELVHDFDTELVNAGGLQQLGGDLDLDGQPELYLQYGDSLRVYESVDSSYATELQDVLQPVLPGYPTGFYSGDFDGDNLQELIYFRNYNSSSPQIAVIREHNPTDGTLDVTTEVIYPGDSGGTTFASADFDGDGSIEFFTANTFGDVFGIENVENDSFKVHYLANIDIVDGAYFLGTNDLDGDGRPECYMSGSFSDQNKYVQRIVVLESLGNDSYEASHYLEFSPGAGSLPLTTGDVDGDGNIELVIRVNDAVAVLDVIGDDRYELFWLKSLPFIDNIGAGDVDCDGIDDIVIAQDIWENNRSYSRSRIYKFNPTSVGIGQEAVPLPREIELTQNYPNPFNPTTHIAFTIAKKTDVTLSIFNVRGQHVETITEGMMQAGEQTVHWNAAGFSSGVYFYRLETPGQIEVRKMVLLR